MTLVYRLRLTVEDAACGRKLVVLRGVTILELLVVMSSITILASILLPAVQSARETARNLECGNHLRQFGVALHAYHDVHRALPAGWQLDPSNRWAYGWGTSVLSEIEESSLQSQTDRTRPMDQLNSAVRSTTPTLFLCPSDTGDPVFPMFAEIGEHGTHAQESEDVLISLPRANYVGVFGSTDPDDVPGETGTGIFVQTRGRRFAELQRGTNRVMMVGERTTRKIPSSWLGFAVEGEDAAGRVVGYADLGPNRDDADECEFDSRHPGHSNFVWADGHVAAVQNEVDRTIYTADAQYR
jgi:prepilin-type processing-associated H-X9-DG protein